MPLAGGDGTGSQEGWLALGKEGLVGHSYSCVSYDCSYGYKGKRIGREGREMLKLCIKERNSEVEVYRHEVV